MLGQLWVVGCASCADGIFFYFGVTRATLWLLTSFREGGSSCSIQIILGPIYSTCKTTVLVGVEYNRKNQAKNHEKNAVREVVKEGKFLLCTIPVIFSCEHEQ